jgi:hypothetical protein
MTAIDCQSVMVALGSMDTSLPFMAVAASPQISARGALAEKEGSSRKKTCFPT